MTSLNEVKANQHQRPEEVCLLKTLISEWSETYLKNMEIWITPEILSFWLKKIKEL